jgi:hypothetical protein
MLGPGIIEAIKTVNENNRRKLKDIMVRVTPQE